MRHTMLRVLTVLVVWSSPLLVTQCGGTGAGTSPSSPGTPAPSPGSAGTPAPAAGSSLSLTPSSIQGQGQPQAVLTLASPAPDSGALVTMTSSNPAVAKVPSTVAVAARSRSVTFLIDTSTVLAATTVTITGTYAGSAISSTLTVVPPPLRASFVARSPARGVGACVMAESQELDCLLDGSSSEGFIDSWIWTYTVGTSTLSHVSKDAGSHPQISTQCVFLNTGAGGDDPNGDRYLKMEITLQVQDRAGVRSETVRQPAKLYPNRQCGFSY